VGRRLTETCPMGGKILAPFQRLPDVTRTTNLRMEVLRVVPGDVPDVVNG